MIIRSASRISFDWYASDFRSMEVSCDTEWSQSRCPAATTFFTRSGWACACVPVTQNVAFTPYSSSRSST